MLLISIYNTNFELRVWSLLGGSCVNCRALTPDYVDGFCVGLWFGWLRAAFRDRSPFLWGMLVYRDLMFTVKRMASAGRSVNCSSFRRK